MYIYETRCNFKVPCYTKLQATLFFPLVVDFHIILSLVKCKTDGHVHVSTYYTYTLASLSLHWFRIL